MIWVCIIPFSETDSFNIWYWNNCAWFIEWKTTHFFIYTRPHRLFRHPRLAAEGGVARPQLICPLIAIELCKEAAKTERRVWDVLSHTMPDVGCNCEIWLSHFHPSGVGHSGADSGGGGHRGHVPHKRMAGDIIVPAFWRFFLHFFEKSLLYHICQMRWPKSEENIEIVGGGLEKLGGSQPTFLLLSCIFLKIIFAKCSGWNPRVK